MELQMFVRILVVSIFVGSTWASSDEPLVGLAHLTEARVEATDFEKIAPSEQEMIQAIVKATGVQMATRYKGGETVRRNQHAKSHGCVAGKFTIREDIDAKYQVGLFSSVRSYDAIVRFSNADSRDRDDSPELAPGVRMHGSRGMAIKVLGISGESLLPQHGALTQDFVMINSPVFVFANVEDYALASRLIAEHGDDKGGTEFFRRRQMPGTTAEQKTRAAETGRIAAQIRSTGTPAPFQTPPTTPLENSYFGAAPFLFGTDQVMRFRVVPIDENAEGKQPLIEESNYLREGLANRLSSGEPVRFVFEAQIRSKAQITDIITQIENASLEWQDNPEEYPWTALADLVISSSEPLDEAVCESLVFTPWHCLKEHQPLGSINRLRKAVYLESAMIRNMPKEPASLPDR
ncbi:hypothetical protein [Novipirellula rosea]